MADEISDRRALLRIARALPLIERTYALIRFLILRVKLLAVMDLLLPSEGRILDVGCGFGLWTAYFGQRSWPIATIANGKRYWKRWAFRCASYAPDILPHPHVIIAARKTHQ